MVYEKTQKCMTMCNYKTDLLICSKCNHILCIKILFSWQDNCVTQHNSFNRKHLQCTDFTQTKNGDVNQQVTSTLTQNQLQGFNTDVKIYTSALFQLQFYLLVSDFKLYIKQKFSKSCLIFVLPLTVTCTVFWCWVTNRSDFFPSSVGSHLTSNFLCQYTITGLPPALYCHMIIHCLL